MFEKITDLSFERNWKQAIGFCLAFLFALVLTALVIGIINVVYMSLAGGLPKDNAVAMQAGHAFGKEVIPVLEFLTTAVALLIVRAKKAYSAIALGCVVLAAVLSVYNMLFSLVFIGYLTTLPKKGN